MTNVLKGYEDYIVTQFEKEAEEAGNDKIKENHQFARCARKSYKDGFKDGAELGYNKANEWHKVADGDLPKDARYVWTNVGAGYHDDDGWWDDCGRLQNVIAWCEPKFEE